VPTTLVVVVGSVEFQFKFLITETPPDLLPNFAIGLINISLLTTFMLGAIIVSILVVIIPTSSD
jgi:hypothetical protein